MCALADLLLLLLPVQLLLLGVFQQDAGQVDFLFRLLFAVYGVLMVEYFEGATIGKRFGRLRVVDSSGGRPRMLYVGLRELVRSMYLIPAAGWLAGAVSVILLFYNGKTLHDMVGGTKVIFQWEYKPPEEDR